MLKETSLFSGAALKISGLPQNITESNVREGFAIFGNILGIKVNYTTPPHAFVTFSKTSEAIAATEHFRQHGYIFRSVRIKISPAVPKCISKPHTIMEIQIFEHTWNGEVKRSWHLKKGL